MNDNSLELLIMKWNLNKGMNFLSFIRKGLKYCPVDRLYFVGVFLITQLCAHLLNSNFWNVKKYNNDISKN